MFDEVKEDNSMSEVHDTVDCEPVSDKGLKDGIRQSHFLAVLSKIDEEDESKIRSPLTSDEDEKRIHEGGQSPHVMWKSENEIIHFDNNKRIQGKQRPKSANCIVDGKSKEETCVKKRSNSARVILRLAKPKSALKTSSCSSRCSDSESNSESSLVSMIGRPRSAGWRPKGFWGNSWESLCLPQRSRSACTVRADDKGTWTKCNGNVHVYRPRKCRSNPNLAKSRIRKSPSTDLQIDKFKRSLKLLGLEISDFGSYESESHFLKFEKPKRSTKSTMCTKLIRRSISLDGLKELVKEAWLDDRLDSSHRKLLAQAAYEEWYFRKAEETHRKLSDERTKSKLQKEKMDREFAVRKAKAEEQFRKWMEGKKRDLKTEKNSKKSAVGQFRLEKSQEDVEIAYRRWKKEKDKQRREKMKLEMQEKERKVEVDKMKEEKKAMAEKAFIEWKRKLLEEEKKIAESKMKKEKRQMEIERKKKEGLENRTSYQSWKDMKDKELREKRLANRNALRIANALRAAQLEERMYEAEQAFEEWLERIELKEKGIQNLFASKKQILSVNT